MRDWREKLQILLFTSLIGTAMLECLLILALIIYALLRG